jgi:hypothetical protein
VSQAVLVSAAIAGLLVIGSCGTALDPCDQVSASAVRRSIGATRAASESAKTNVAGNGNCTYGITFDDGRSLTLHIHLVEYGSQSEAGEAWWPTDRSPNVEKARVRGFDRARLLAGASGGPCSSDVPFSLTVGLGKREALIELQCAGDAGVVPERVLRAVAERAIAPWARRS